MFITRQKFVTSASHIFSSLLCLSEMGIRVDSENHISSIVPGSVAADEGRIAVGDKIITVRRVVT